MAVAQGYSNADFHADAEVYKTASNYTRQRLELKWGARSDYFTAEETNSYAAAKDGLASVDFAEVEKRVVSNMRECRGCNGSGRWASGGRCAACGGNGMVCPKPKKLTKKLQACRDFLATQRTSFAQSLLKQLDERGSLSEKQLEAARAMYRKQQETDDQREALR